MALELSELAAGLPMAASLALAGGFSGIRGGRRRAALNQALHEVRRPLQVLALSLPADLGVGGGAGSSLALATAALEKLEREINGMAPAEAAQPVSVGLLAEAATERWRTVAAGLGKLLVLRSESAGPVLWGVESELSQALDNLISNGLRHGGAELVLGVREVGGWALVEVWDSGATAGARAPSRTRLSGMAGLAGRRSPHGHGLRIVRRIAAAHGGTFELRTEAGGTSATISLPLGRGHE
jgi:signal transduction histidine kinase